MAASTALDPHGQQGVLTAGPELEKARGVVVLAHGRGASAKGMLELYFELVAGEPWAGELGAVAPQAANFTWYPQSFLAPMEANQPYLDSALRRMESVVAELIAGRVPSERIALLGFSQGACLVCEFAARHPRRHGAVIALTGGLIGPPGTPREYPGSLDGTPVFLGTSDPDPHVPFQRVQETREVFERMGAAVELRRYPGMAHTISTDELAAARALLGRMMSGGAGGAEGAGK